MRLFVSALAAATVSSTDRPSGKETQDRCVNARSRKSADRSLPSRSISAINASAWSVTYAPVNASTITRCLACMRSNTDATRRSISGIVSMRSVCPVGAVSTTIRSNRLSLPKRAISMSAAISSTPGNDRRSRVETSSLSSHVPRSAICSSTWRRVASHRSSAAGPSISAAYSVPLPIATRRGRSDRRTFSASPSDGAGSVEMTRVAIPRVAAATAIEAAHVVLPAPPFPPTKWNREVEGIGSAAVVLVALECRVDAGDGVIPRRECCGGGTLPPVADVAQARQDVRLEAVEILLRHLAEFNPHLGGQQLLAQGGVVVHLGIDRGSNLVEHEPQAAHEERINDEHNRLRTAECRQSAFRHSSVGPFELQPDVHEVVGRPRAGKLERELVVTLTDVADARVERLFGASCDQECGIHDHPVANRLIRARRHGDVSQRFEDLAHVALRPRLQRGIDQAPVLHASEIGGSCLRRNLPFQAVDVFVFRLDLMNDQVAIPQNFQSELQLILHLVQHVGERVVRGPQELDDVVVGLEDRAERHRNDGVLLHDRLVDALMR